MALSEEENYCNGYFLYILLNQLYPNEIYPLPDYSQEIRMRYFYKAFPFKMHMRFGICTQRIDMNTPINLQNIMINIKLVS